VYTSLLLPDLGYGAVAVYLFMFGTFYAATDGVLAAMASAILPEHLRASGLSLLVAVTSLGRLVASIVFGLMWTLMGMQDAVAAFALGLLAIAVVAGVSFASRTRLARG
jgi:MFS family permease